MIALQILSIIEHVTILYVVCSSMESAQNRYYTHVREDHRAQDLEELQATLEGHVKEWSEYKKRVDTLTLKSGFKL